MKGLTPKQHLVLSLIAAHWAEFGRGPSVRSLMEPMGVTSTCTIQRHLDALEKKGFIERDRYGYRSMRPTGTRLIDPADLRRLLSDAADALEPFAAGADVIGTWNPGEPMPDAGRDPSFLDCQRAAATLAAIRAQIGGGPCA